MARGISMSIILRGRVRTNGSIHFSYNYIPPVVYPPEPPYWIINEGNIGTFEENTTVNLELTAGDINNDIQSFVVTAGQLPPGLSLNILSGVISGTIDPVDGNQFYEFTVTVTDETGNTLVGDFEIIVVDTGTQVLWITPEGNFADPAAGQNFAKPLEAKSV